MPPTLTKEEANAVGGQSLANGGYRTAPSPQTITLTPENIAAVNAKNATTRNIPTTPASPTPDSLMSQLNNAQSILNNLKAKDATTASNIVTSDEAPAKDETKATNAILERSKITRDTSYLDNEIARIEANLKGQERSINAGFDSLKTTQTGQQASETGQTSAGLAAAGGYLGFSGSGTGVMLNLAKSHRAEMQALESKRQQAIADARSAAAGRRFDVVKLKAQEIKDIEQEQYVRDQDYYKKTKEIADEEKIKADTLANQDTIFKAIQAGNKTPEAIFKALGSKVDIETINKFIDNITPPKKEGDSFSYSKTDVASLLGAGLGQDDISALNETVNELGYTDAVRNTLPSAVRVAADKIYRGKTGTGEGSSTDVYIGGKKIKSVTQQVIDGFTKMDKLTPTVQQQVRDDLYSLGFASDTAPEWFDEDIVKNPDISSLAFNTSSPYATPALTGVTAKRDRNKLWQQYTRTLINGEDAADDELDAVNLQVEADATAKER